MCARVHVQADLCGCMLAVRVGTRALVDVRTSADMCTRTCAGSPFAGPLVGKCTSVHGRAKLLE